MGPRAGLDGRKISAVHPLNNFFFANFLVVAVSESFVFVWVHGTTPRFCYDKLTY